MREREVQSNFVLAVCKDGGERFLASLGEGEPFSLLNLLPTKEVADMVGAAGVQLHERKAYVLCQVAGLYAFGILDPATATKQELLQVTGMRDEAINRFLGWRSKA